MAGRPKLLQPDGLERQSNPVTRDKLRDACSDGKWRTVHDMAYLLQDQIPPEVAVRAVLRSPNLVKADMATKIQAGSRRLVRETAIAAVTSGVFESRGHGSGREFRCLKPTPDRMRVGRRLSPEEMARPADSTQYGVSRPQVYQAITENPKSDIDALVARLLPCMIDGKIVDRYVDELVRVGLDDARKKKPRRGEVEIRAEVEAGRDADPAGFLIRARQSMVRMIISDLIGRKLVTESRVFVPAEE